MHRFQYSSQLAATPRELFAWHDQPAAIRRMLPPWQPLRVLSASEHLETGSGPVLELAFGPCRLRWHARHESIEPGAGFVDVQDRGPFRSWRHVHRFEPLPSGAGSVLRDRITYSTPLGSALEWALAPLVDHQLRRTFRYRHQTLQGDLDMLHKYSTQASMRIAITGSTGLLGQPLCGLLQAAGHQVTRLVRDPARGGTDTALWYPETGLANPKALEGYDAVVHLAGENIAARRWSAMQKERIYKSRVDATRHLVASFCQLNSPPKVFICASAVGYYGETGDHVVDEGWPGGEGFLANVCRGWEAAADGAEDCGARVVKMRFGVLLSPRGGALRKMLLPFRLGLGGVVGSGEQHVSWISVDDAATAVVHALHREDLRGPVNVVSPQPLTNRALTRTLGRVLRRPTIAPLPGFAVGLLFGEMGEATLLSSCRVQPSRLQASGFEHRHPALESCLRHALGRAEARPSTAGQTVASRVS